MDTIYKENLYDTHDPRINKLHEDDRAFHDWYRFVLSYPPHLVRDYIKKFGLSQDATLLDPFCGTGTTLVEAKKHNIFSFGIEAHPMAHYASGVKTKWDIDTKQLLDHANSIFSNCKKERIVGKLLRFNPEQEKLLLKNSISDLPLHKCLRLLGEIHKRQAIGINDIELLALAYVCVYKASNLKFGPEVGVKKTLQYDCDVYEEWIGKIHQMADDLKCVDEYQFKSSNCILNDARNVVNLITPNSIDCIITSPPYPNEKDYTRTTRLETILLGFVNTKLDLRKIKKDFVRSNTRSVYVGDEDDHCLRNSKILNIADEIERRRIALNKTSGFERLYARVTKLYFGGMQRHLESLKTVLKPGAKLAYVVGDQASYLQVLIRTGELLAEIADQLGYTVINVDLFRTRQSTVTGNQLREEVVVLEWKGNHNNRRSIVKKADSKPNVYDKLIESVFFKHYHKGNREIHFDRDEFEAAARKLKIKLPKNLGDIIYSYRYRVPLPVSIRKELKNGEEWVIRSTGKGKYSMTMGQNFEITPNQRLSDVKILDSTPEIVKRYALNDEQALLAILRYNRLIDIFTGIACYSLQNHLRTYIEGMGQVETDELYVGVNKNGAQYIFPVQAKGEKEQLGIVQIEQDFAVGREKFSSLICRPLGAQFIKSDLIALFEFEIVGEDVKIKEEKHYRIVPNANLSVEELEKYNINE